MPRTKVLVCAFIARGADDWNERLSCAAEGEHLDLIDFLIEKGANNWVSGLRGAARGGHPDLVDFFMAKLEEEINTELAEGMINEEYALFSLRNYLDQGLHSAASGGYRDLVAFFLQGSATDPTGALMQAVRGDHIGVVKFLVEEGVYRPALTHAMFIAVQKGYKDLVKFFKDQGVHIPVRIAKKFDL